MSTSDIGNEAAQSRGIEPGTVAAVALAGKAAIGIVNAFDVTARGAVIAGAFVNGTCWDFSPRRGCNKPASGSWVDPPQPVYSAVSPIQTLIDEGKSPEEAARIVSEAPDHLRRLVSTFSLKGSLTGGAWSLAVFDIDASYGQQLSVACYISLHYGSYSAGVSLSTDDWIGKSADGEGKNLIAHIKNMSSVHCQLSEGQTCQVEIGRGEKNIPVIFTAGERVMFQVGG